MHVSRLTFIERLCRDIRLWWSKAVQVTALTWSRNGTNARFVPLRRCRAPWPHRSLICTAKLSERRVDCTETPYSTVPWLTMGWRITFQGSSDIKNPSTICPSLCVSSHLCFMWPPSGSRGGLNGDSVASCEQYPDAVWVCQVELQHQWFCCQGEDDNSGNLFRSTGAWRSNDDDTLRTLEGGSDHFCIWWGVEMKNTGVVLTSVLHWVSRVTVDL